MPYAVLALTSICHQLLGLQWAYSDVNEQDSMLVLAASLAMRLYLSFLGLDFTGTVEKRGCWCMFILDAAAFTCKTARGVRRTARAMPVRVSGYGKRQAAGKQTSVRTQVN